MTAEIAVIIPTYNRAASLKRAIDSVRAQTCPAREIIVVDDGSDDDTGGIVQRYPNCRYAKIEHSGLPAVARNVGIRMTDAPYVAFLDSDDEWRPHKLKTQIGLIGATPCGLVSSNASLISGDDRVVARPYLPVGQTHAGRVLKDLLADNFVITSSVVVRRELLERAGGFSQDPMLRGVEDYDLWLRLAAVTNFHYIDEELLLYRDSTTGLSRSRSRLSHCQGMELIFSRAARTVQQRDDHLRAVLNRQLVSYRRLICEEHLALHQYREFAKSLPGLCVSAARRVLGRF